MFRAIDSVGRYIGLLRPSWRKPPPPPKVTSPSLEFTDRSERPRPRGVRSAGIGTPRGRGRSARITPSPVKTSMTETPWSDAMVSRFRSYGCGSDRRWISDHERGGRPRAPRPPPLEFPGQTSTDANSAEYQTVRCLLCWKKGKAISPRQSWNETDENISQRCSIANPCKIQRTHTKMLHR